MRRKGNLETRAANCPSLYEVGDDALDSRVEEERYIDLSKWKNAVLEVGCGKGKFALEYSKSHNETAYVAVEKMTNVIIEGAEKAADEGVENLLFLRTGAEYLKRYFKEGTFDKVFLNFPCPYKKESYRDRRLTAPSFLEIYDALLVDGGEICLKTDNKRMFEYSLESFSSYGLLITDVTLDLHSSKYVEGNVMTEYESKFFSMGVPILRVVAKKR